MINPKYNKLKKTQIKLKKAKREIKHLEDKVEIRDTRIKEMEDYLMNLTSAMIDLRCLQGDDSEVLIQKIMDELSKYIHTISQDTKSDFPLDRRQIGNTQRTKNFIDKAFSSHDFISTPHNRK
jgi:archaellum component FlaC